MPGREWGKALDALLELLRLGLPVPHMEEHIQGIADLGRWRAAIEAGDMQNINALSNLAKEWYSKAIKNIPVHHLVSLASPNAIQQVANYTTSLAEPSASVSAEDERFIYTPFTLLDLDTFEVATLSPDSDGKTREDMRMELLQLQTSIHNATEAVNYCLKFSDFSNIFAEDAINIARNYLGTPRTTVGWKGLLKEPTIDDIFQVDKSIRHGGYVFTDHFKCKHSTSPAICDYVSTIIGAHIARIAEKWAPAALNSPLPANIDVWNSCKQRATLHLKTEELSMTKRGLLGLVNGKRVSALPDTGAEENIISESYARTHSLPITPGRRKFRLGNRTTIYSEGRPHFHDNLFYHL